MSICLASNNNYAEHMLVTIFSLAVNLSINHIADIYILDWWISEINKQKLKDLEKKFKNLTITFMKVDDSILADLPSLHLSKETYYRLLLADVFKKLDTILRIDCDIVINGDISPIFETNLTNMACGAVNENTMCSLYYKNVLNIASETFFNAWVMLINLSYRRENNISTKLLNWLNTNKDKLLAMDQDALNAICYDKYLPLPRIYNALPKVRWGHINATKKQKKQKPLIIHFAWPKPRNKYCFNSTKNLYHNYRRQAGLQDIKYSKKIETNRLIHSIGWFLGSSLFNLLPAFWQYYLIFKPRLFLRKYTKIF